MFFFFSKVLFFIICPIDWVLALLIAAAIAKGTKLKQRLIIIAAAILLVFSIPYIFQEFAEAWDIQPVKLKPTDKFSCAIILGGFVNEDGKGNVWFTDAADRFIEAIRLYNEGKVSHILISGGNAALKQGPFKEADWAKIQLQQFNIPDSCILVEDRSRNTLENSAFTKVVLEQSHLQPPYLLVTSGFHMRRSLGIFKNDKIDVRPYPCAYLIGKSHFSYRQCIPNAEIFSKWLYYIKEMVGVMVNKIR